MSLLDYQELDSFTDFVEEKIVGRSDADERIIREFIVEIESAGLSNPSNPYHPCRYIGLFKWYDQNERGSYSLVHAGHHWKSKMNIFPISASTAGSFIRPLHQMSFSPGDTYESGCDGEYRRVLVQDGYSNGMMLSWWSAHPKSYNVIDKWVDAVLDYTLQQEKTR